MKHILKALPYQIGQECHCTQCTLHSVTPTWGSRDLALAATSESTLSSSSRKQQGTSSTVTQKRTEAARWLSFFLQNMLSGPVMSHCIRAELQHTWVDDCAGLPL